MTARRSLWRFRRPPIRQLFQFAAGVEDTRGFFAPFAGGPDPSQRRIGVAPAVNLPDIAAFTAEREVIQPGAIPYPIEQLALGLCLGIGPAA